MLFYSQYRYSELSKLFLFLFSWYQATNKYICYYIPLTHNDFLISNMFYIKLSQKFVFLTNIKSVVSWIFSNTTFSKHSKKSISFNFDQHHNSQNAKFLLPQHSNHWMTKQYRESADHGKVDIDSDASSLDSGNLTQPTTIPIQCERLP